MAPAPIRLLVAGDVPEARAELAARLAAEPDCIVVGQFDSPDLDAAEFAGVEPDVIVWLLGDDSEPPLWGLADAEELRIPIVALAQDERDGGRALALGAAGVLASPAATRRIVLAARAVLGGLLALDPSVAGPRVAGVDGARDGAAGGAIHSVDDGGGDDGRTGAGDPADDAPAEPLTRREHEVLGLVARGLGNKQIAQRLGITEHTAKFHVHIILGKLGTQSRTEAVVRAARLGLIAI